MPSKILCTVPECIYSCLRNKPKDLETHIRNCHYLHITIGFFEGDDEYDTTHITRRSSREEITCPHPSCDVTFVDIRRVVTHYKNAHNALENFKMKCSTSNVPRSPEHSPSVSQQSAHVSQSVVETPLQNDASRTQWAPFASQAQSAVTTPLAHQAQLTTTTPLQNQTPHPFLSPSAFSTAPVLSTPPVSHSPAGSLFSSCSSGGHSLFSDHSPPFHQPTIAHIPLFSSLRSPRSLNSLPENFAVESHSLPPTQPSQSSPVFSPLLSPIHLTPVHQSSPSPSTFMYYTFAGGQQAPTIQPDLDGPISLQGRPTRSCAKKSYVESNAETDESDADESGEEIPMEIDAEGPTNPSDMDITEDDSQDGSQDDEDSEMLSVEIKKILEKAGLVYIHLNPVSAIACQDCTRAVFPKTALGHSKREHGLIVSRLEVRLFKEWVTPLLLAKKLAMKAVDIHYDKLPHSVLPFPGLLVQDGLGCAADSRCRFATTTEGMINQHWSTAHAGGHGREWERSQPIKMQTFFWSQKIWFRVCPHRASLLPHHPFSIYVKDFAPLVANCSAIGTPPLSTTEVPVLLKSTQWHDHLKSYTGNRKKIRDLLSLMDPPTRKAAKKTWLGKPLQEAVLRYYDTTLHQGLKAPDSIKRILGVDIQKGKKNPWNPLDKHGTRLRYARLLYVFSYAILSSLNGHQSGYSIPLTGTDRENAKHLKDVLILKGSVGSDQEGDVDDDGKDEDEQVEDDGEDMGVEGKEGNEDQEDDQADDLGGPINVEDDEESDDEDFISLVDHNENEASDRDAGPETFPTRTGQIFDIDEDGGAVDAFHRFIKPFLYPRKQEPSHTYDKWNHPIECLLAIRNLRPDGTFQEASDTTQIFAILHYHIRATSFYEGISNAKRGRFNGDLYKAVAHEIGQSRPEGDICAYNICEEYQRIATRLARAFNKPPTTRVSEDGMTISFRETALAVPAFRAGLRRCKLEAEELLRDICYGEDFGLGIPDHVPDDWANTERGYSWLNNAKFLPESLALLHKIMDDKNSKLAHVVGGARGKRTPELKLNKAAVKRILDKCDALNEKLALLATFTPALVPRITQFLEHKYANGTRPRTLFRDAKSLWLVVRRSKTESMIRREVFIPAKCPPEVTSLLQTYLVVVRPLEVELAYHLYGPHSVRQYREYLWMNDGARTIPKQMYTSVANFFSEYCDAPGVGVREYRQICVEISRLFLGSEADIRRDRSDLIDNMMNHSTEATEVQYANEVNQLPCMSSTLLHRYGAVSEAWWQVVGFLPNKPPLAPLAARRKAEREIVPTLKANIEGFQKQIEDLKKQVGLLTEREAGYKEAFRKLRNSQQQMESRLTDQFRQLMAAIAPGSSST
ncbi:hypothetical protein GALMADRAFT_147700 [Galerina marginata CBS 339.88]|uniref:C2H2-type domain-containing protein n=1 Tax=Galerina marginata (strain CBS 339.88) TaxID=685588 RepID=A0A067SFZ0_GALM3|nr:hypothetical protein GALMADRAFT_147700 [Galerina marginata CBS 339.88]